MVLRRLNRAEYENTVRDLLGVDVDLKDLLPADTSANGFDNSAEALHVSSFLMEQYLEAADRVLDAAIANGPQPWMIKKRFDIKDEKSVKPKGSVYRHLDDGVAIFSSWVSANIQVTLWQFYAHGPRQVPLPHLRLRLPDRQAGHLPRDGRAGLAGVTEQRLVGYFDAPADKPTVVEFVEQSGAARTRIRIVADGLPA